MIRQDLTGKTFNSWTVLRLSIFRGKHNEVFYQCQCNCGTIKHIQASKLKSGKSTKCRSCVGSHNHYKNGKQSPTYVSWRRMLGRCFNINDPAYKYYGARGIGVHESWFKFINFLDDMGERPENKTLERTDNNGDYTPTNCCWATAKQQANNRG